MHIKDLGGSIMKMDISKATTFSYNILKLVWINNLSNKATSAFRSRLKSSHTHKYATVSRVLQALNWHLYKSLIGLLDTLSSSPIFWC